MQQVRVQKPNQNPFEDLESKIQQLDNGMDFHQETCELCTDQGSCDIWNKLVEEWTFLALLERRIGTTQTQDTA
jgi:hypothetical protein